MQFKDGVGVYSFTGQHVGRVDRVVLNPQTKAVTDLIVRKGSLFAEDKVVPLSLIASATEERVTLRKDAGPLEALPTFQAVHYIPLETADALAAEYGPGLAGAVYWYPSPGSLASYQNGIGYDYEPPYQVETDSNIPDDTVAIKEGASVFNVNKARIGNVARVLTAPPGNQISAFLIAEGLLFKQKKLIPVSWIREIQEGAIYLNVGNAILEKLPDFQEA